MTPIFKDTDEEYKWSKLGEYTGNKKITNDYINLEPEIEMVYAYHIYEIPLDEVKKYSAIKI